MNIKTAQAQVKHYGLVLCKRDGEYRVSVPFEPSNRERSENLAHYTTDLQDAVDTACLMALQLADNN